jgi:hypothetical protein
MWGNPLGIVKNKQKKTGPRGPKTAMRGQDN